MYVSFTSLVEQLGRSVQDAQNRLDQEAVDTFFRCFETISQPVNGRGRSDDGRDVWDIPVTRRLGIPASGGELKAVDVPVAALLQHQTMCLDTVKVRLSLNTQVRKEDGMLLVEPGPAGMSGEEETNAPLGEAEFIFKAAPPAEGVARLNLNVQKTL